MKDSCQIYNVECSQFIRPFTKQVQYNQLNFLLLDCDYEISTSLIRLFGITQSGETIQILVKDYHPYFYVALADNLTLDDQEIEQFRIQFNRYINNSGLFNDNESIIKIELTEKEAVRNFKGYDYKKQNYLKLYFKSIHVMKKVNGKIEKGLSFSGFEIMKQTYESKISHPLKFMVDQDLRGMGWVQLKNLTESREDSNCSLSFEIKSSNITFVDEQLTQPAFRILSIDFMTNCNAALTFDDETEILLVSCVLDDSELKQNLIFTTKKIEQMNNAIIFQCKNESELLKKFHDVFIAWDPDFITGYNLHHEILPFIIHRTKKLHLDEIYINYGRVKGEESIVTQSRFYSTVMRLRETKNVIINGRVQIDTLICMLRDTKISQYSLGSIYFSIFNRQIEYYEQETINQLVSNNNIKRIAQYSLKRSNACLEIINYKGWIITYSQIAFTTGVPINYIIMRGQSIKVLSQLLRQSKKYDYIIPDENNVRSNESSNLQGALVLPAQKGFYKDPLVLFDFVSLYPSIVIAYNMCYSTLLNDEKLEISEDDYFKIPQTGFKFVKQHVRKGILPQILESLLKQRAETKNELKANPINYAILDAKQYALKIAANSIFGFTGCSDHGYLPCLEITSSIMRIGRVILSNAVQILHKNYPNAKILYGDTDSLLVNFGIKNPGETQEIAIKASQLVSSHFLSPIQISYDKLFSPFLLICKKRYVGLSWKNGQTIDKIEHKGICTVRRDNCLYLRKILNLVLHQILIEQDFQSAIDIVREKMLKLLNGEVSIYDLIITKSLAITVKENNQIREEENTQGNDNFHSYPDKYHDNWEQRKQPHVKVATQKVKNNQAKAFQKGDRISYVITDGILNNQVSEVAEDPIFAFQHQLPINIQYYFNQIKLPIMHIFEHLIPNPEALFNMQNYSSQRNKSQKKQVINKNEKNLSKYLRKRNFCLNCNEEIPFNNVICYNCRSSKSTILTQISNELCIQQNKFHKYSMICLRCQNNSYEEIICKNQECHIYYKRQESESKFNEIQDKFDKVFHSDW